MAFNIDLEHLPAILTNRRMTDSEFAELCADHPDLFFETSAEEELIVMPPKFTIDGVRNAEITTQLGNWSIADGHGAVTASSTGFVLPNGARRSPG